MAADWRKVNNVWLAHNLYRSTNIFLCDKIKVDVIDRLRSMNRDVKKGSNLLAGRLDRKGDPGAAGKITLNGS